MYVRFFFQLAANYTFYLVIFLLFTTIVNAQEIKGIVKDESNGLPIRDVHIRQFGKNRGAVTDISGFFQISVLEYPVTLQFSHVSYKDNLITIQQPTKKIIFIYLSPRTIDLEEAEISSKKYKIIKDLHKDIVDYGFIDTNLIVLVKNRRNTRYELTITTAGFDTLCTKVLSNSIKAKSIFKDCFGNCHLVTDDSAYQIFFNGKVLDLIYPVATQRFYRSLGNCLFETPDYLFFIEKENIHPESMYAAHKPEEITKPSANGNWQQTFYAINKTTHEKIVIDKFDECKKRIEAFEYSKFIFYNQIDTTRYFGDILRFNEMSFYKPAFQSLHYLNDTIYYFNHRKSNILIYSNDIKLLNTIFVKYNKNNNWEQTIIIDETKNKAYTTFLNGATLTVKEIEIKTGNTKNVITIEKPFPEKVKINNGFIYFLYINFNNDWGHKALYQGELP